MAVASQTISGMGKRKLPADTKPDIDEAKKPKRKGYQIHCFIDPNVGDAMERFKASHRFPPNQVDVVEVALSEFLTREGFPPATDA